ncbi:hypothetical protein KR018_003202 [Drosophila ironensis]|nr:hypothetical protein KR018_003202 [Drosophila ironensis]
MAMHSYQRQEQDSAKEAAATPRAMGTGATNAPEEMHGFLKDKQAWEHAIALYQGPDPLDHWYNYICWYENHEQSDPEAKYRETLERCLTEYEHNDYYRQDARLVRLWLKYIAMQADPLHFYQVLFHRGTGRHVAAFYIGWAGYYEAREEFKDAEAVFNLAFQEKAQTTAELHQAHTKFSYARNLFYQRQEQLLQQQAAQQQQQQAPHPLQQLTNYAQQPLPQSFQQQQPQQQAQQPPQLRPQQPYQQHIYQQYQAPQAPPAPFQAPHYQPQTRYDPPAQPAPPAPPAPPPVQSQYPEPHFVHNQQQQPVQQQSQQQAQQQAQQLAQQQAQQSPAEQQLKNGNSGADREPAGLRLPRNFYSYGRNNHETWKPALTLEEPEDPSRVCRYAKQLVYPLGAGIEYSPEEIRARKYKQVTEPRAKPAEQQGQQQSHYDSYGSDTSYYMTAVDGALYGHNNHSGGGGQENAADGDEDNEAEEEGDEEAAEEEEDSNEEDGDEEEAEEEEEDDEEEEDEECNANGVQFSAQTTFAQENRSIKIKFKKEPSNNYSAYTIENVYQQQQHQYQHQHQQQHQQHQQLQQQQIHHPSVAEPAPASPIAVHKQRNGGGHHHFHPYMLGGQTSTPKSEPNGHRRPRSKARRSKFQPDPYSNSNSASSAADVAGSALPAAAAPGASFSDNANFSFSSASALDNSNSSLSLAVDRLNFRDSSQLNPAINKTLKTHNNNNSTSTNNNGNSTTLADFSTFQENSYFATQHDTEAQERRLSKALETIARHMAKEAIDPFNSELCRAFLTKVDFPGEQDAHASYKIVQTPLPKISNTRTLNVFEGITFNIDKEVGRGAYGSVYKATDSRTGNVVALKYQKPPNTWEIYICEQVLKRIKNPEVLPGLMDISTAIIAPNASLIATEFSPFGSLLDINNKIRQATTKVMHESLVMHFSAQICNIVDHLHRHHIIHADIKPDNFLLMRVPSVDSVVPSLRLIDFGCAIDISLFPDGERTKFRKVVQTDGFTCIEMQEGRSWSYETDLFCIAATVHTMLFGDYMQPQKRGAGWEIRQKLPRYLKKHVWTKFFGELLNMQADKLPKLQEMREIFDEEAYRMDSELQKQMRTLSNILHRR